MRALFSVLAIGITATSANALVISGYSSARHHRFLGGNITQPNPTFIGVEYDLSGIATNAGAVMISPHYFVTAAHTGTPGSLTFAARGGGTVTKAVAGSTVVLTEGVASDLRIGRLGDGQGLTPADDVAWYPVIVQPESWYVGRSIFVYGQSNQAGVNTIDFIDLGEFDGGASPTRVVGYYYDTTDIETDEARLIGGDSGKPLGMIWEGQYSPLGAHYGIGTISSTVTVSASSFVPYYLDQINAYMAPSGEQVTILAVPEPQLACIAAAGAIVGLIRRRNSPRTRLSCPMCDGYKPGHFRYTSG